MITKIINGISLIFFPSSCFSCHKEGEPLCDECLSRIRRSTDTPFPFITTIYSYKDPLIKKAIHRIKYFHRKDLISPFAKKIAEELRQKDNAEYCLVPIPMPNKRKSLRGYNHAEALAQEISVLTGIPLDTTILVRTKMTKQQAKAHSKRERFHNQHNSFEVLKKCQKKRILLIDDVTTTSATLLEARKKLLQNDALSVEAFTIAH